jgi:hypothetical protein
VKNLEEYSCSAEESLRLFIERREFQYQHENIERARIVPLSVLMKTVSATILSQPNRSPRDYKKLFNDNASLLFSEQSDVQLYHAVAYLYYRLEFLWRNNRIDAALKIYRFYIIWAAFREATSNQSFLKPLKQNAYALHANKVIELAKDEDAFKKAVEKYGKSLNEVTRDLSPENRERLRDSIRSDSFFTKVAEKIFGTGTSA